MHSSCDSTCTDFVGQVQRSGLHHGEALRIALPLPLLALQLHHHQPSQDLCSLHRRYGTFLIHLCSLPLPLTHSPTDSKPHSLAHSLTDAESSPFAPACLLLEWPTHPAVGASHPKHAHLLPYIAWEHVCNTCLPFSSMSVCVKSMGIVRMHFAASMIALLNPLGALHILAPEHVLGYQTSLRRILHSPLESLPADMCAACPASTCVVISALVSVVYCLLTVCLTPFMPTVLALNNDPAFSLHHVAFP